MTPASTIVGRGRTKGLHAKKKTARLWVTFAVVFIFVLAKTSQELQMLSSVTLKCQVSKIVMNSGSQLSEL